MGDSALLTLVTPAYNQGKYLGDTIDSVLAQDYGAIDYHVIDDGSTDSTPRVLESYAERVQAERQPNMGQVRTLNKAWGRASGKYLAYLSSDDILYPSAVRKLIALLEADPGIACVFPDADLIDERSRVIKGGVCRSFDLAELVVKQECYIGPGAIFRRSAFHAVGGWKPDLRLAPDREFWMRLATQGRIHFHPEALAGYRMHPRSISYKDVSEQTSREYIRVLDDYFSSPTVPVDIAARKDEAYGYATLILARNCFRAGDLMRGAVHYKEACRLHPALGSAGVKVRLLRNVISKPARIALSGLRSAFRASGT